jgi:hypothetical protein
MIFLNMRYEISWTEFFGSHAGVMTQMVLKLHHLEPFFVHHIRERTKTPFIITEGRIKAKMQ